MSQSTKIEYYEDASKIRLSSLLSDIFVVYKWFRSLISKVCKNKILILHELMKRRLCSIMNSTRNDGLSYLPRIFYKGRLVWHIKRKLNNTCLSQNKKAVPKPGFHLCKSLLCLLLEYYRLCSLLFSQT